MAADSIQRLLVINLSITEAIMSSIGVIATVSEMISYKEGASSNTFDKYVTIPRNTGLVFMYFLSMIYITVDRLLEIHLNIKYPLYCSQTKTKWLLITAWMIAILMSLSVIFVTMTTEFNYEEPFNLYHHTPLSLAFIVVAIMTYVSIFNKYRHTRIRPSQDNNGRSSADISIFTIFRNSKFFVSVLLISTFLLFVELPGLIFLLVAFVYKRRTYVMGSCYMILYNISNTVDVFVYVYFQKDVRKLFWKWIRKWNICRDEQTQRVRGESTRETTAGKSGSSIQADTCEYALGRV